MLVALAGTLSVTTTHSCGTHAHGDLVSYRNVGWIDDAIAFGLLVAVTIAKALLIAPIVSPLIYDGRLL